MAISAIVLDSNALRASGWPRVSADLENLFRLASVFVISVYIPDAVQEELLEHWRSTSQKKVEELEGALRKLARDNPADQNIRAIQLQSVADRVAELKANSEKVISEWKIERLPLTQRTCEELFHLAARKEPPFTEGGRGFKDAVILLSAVDYFASHFKPTPQLPVTATVAFVSADSDFEGSPLLTEKRDFEIALFKDIQQVVRTLEEQIETVVKSFRDRDSALARSALEERLPALEQFLRENLLIRSSDLPVFGNLMSIVGLTVNAIGDVRTTYLSKKDAEPTKISADIKISIATVVKRLESPPPPVLSVGQAAPVLPFGEMRQEEQVIKQTVTLEATGDRGVDGYTNLKFLSAKIKRSGRLSYLSGPAGLGGSRVATEEEDDA